MHQLNLKLKDRKFLNINLYEIRIDDNMINNDNLLDQFFFDCQCALFLVDISNPQSFKPIEKLLTNIKENTHPYLKKIIIENKSDIKIEKVDKTITNFNNFFSYLDNITISLKTGDNFENLLNEIYNSINPVSQEKNLLPINQVVRNNLNSYSKIYLKGSISLILVGDQNVGKTSLLLRYINNIFNFNILQTVGIDYKTQQLTINEKELYELILWDTSGQEVYRSLPRSYYKNIDGVLLLFNVNNKNTFTDVSRWMEDIKEYSVRKKPIVENKTQNIKDKKVNDDVVIYLIGNKIDNANNDEERVVTKEEAEKLAKELGVKYYEISCYWNLNIEEVMTRIILDCYNNGRHKDNKFKLKNINNQNRFCC